MLTMGLEQSQVVPGLSDVIEIVVPRCPIGQRPSMQFLSRSCTETLLQVELL